MVNVLYLDCINVNRPVVISSPLLIRSLLSAVSVTCGQPQSDCVCVCVYFIIPLKNILEMIHVLYLDCINVKQASCDKVVPLIRSLLSAVSVFNINLSLILKYFEAGCGGSRL